MKKREAIKKFKDKDNIDQAGEKKRMFSTGFRIKKWGHTLLVPKSKSH